MTVTTRRSGALQAASPPNVSGRRSKRTSESSGPPSSSSSSSAPSRRSHRLNPGLGAENESPRKRPKRSMDVPSPRNRPSRVRTPSAKAKATADSNPQPISKGNDTEQPSGIMPLSVVDVGVVKGLSDTAPSLPPSSPSGLKISTPGAASPPLESNPSPPPSPVSPKASPKSPPTSPGSQPINLSQIPVSPISLPVSGLPVPPISPLHPADVPIDPTLLDGDYSEEDAEGEPDDSLFMAGSPLFDPSAFVPSDTQPEEVRNPTNRVHQGSTVPDKPSPLKIVVSCANDDDDEADMEEIITISRTRSETSSVSYRVSPSNPNIWETACKLRVWEMQKRYNLHPHLLRSYEEERADGFWRRHGWPADLPHGEGRGLLTRTPPATCKRLSPSPTHVPIDLPSASPGAGPGPSTLASLLATAEQPTEPKETNASPDSMSQDEAVNTPPTMPSPPPETNVQPGPIEKRLTRAQKKAQASSNPPSSPSPSKAKGKGKQKAPPPSPSLEDKRVTRSSAAATSTPASPSNARKRKAATSLPPRKPRKSARLSAKHGADGEGDENEKAEENEVESDLLSPSDKEVTMEDGTKKLPPAWWDDDDSLSDLTESDEEDKSKQKATTLVDTQSPASKVEVPLSSTEKPKPPPIITQFERVEDVCMEEVDDDETTDEDDDDASVELTADQKAEFEGMMSKGSDEAFLNFDLTSAVSPVLENSPGLPAEARSSQLPEVFPASPMPSNEPTESTFYIQPVQSPIATTPLTPYVQPGMQPQQLQLTPFPPIPPLSSIPVPGLRQLDLSVPKPPNCVELGGRRKGERQLGLVGGWGTPVNRKRRKLWGQVAKGKGKEAIAILNWSLGSGGVSSVGVGVSGSGSHPGDNSNGWSGWTSESEDEEDVRTGRTGTLKRREFIPKPPPTTSATATNQMYQQSNGQTTSPQMMMSPFQSVSPATSGAASGSYQPQDLMNLFGPPPTATTSNASPSTTNQQVPAGARRANPAEVDTPEWEGLMPPSSFYDLFPSGTMTGDGSGQPQGDSLFFPQQWQHPQMTGHQASATQQQQQQQAGTGAATGPFMTATTPDTLGISWDSFTTTNSATGASGGGAGADETNGGAGDGSGGGLSGEWASPEAFASTSTGQAGQWFTTPAHHHAAHHHHHNNNWVQSTTTSQASTSASTGGELQYALGGGVSC